MLMGLVKFFLWLQVIAVCIVVLLWTSITIREYRVRKNCGTYKRKVRDTVKKNRRNYD